MFFFFQAEDGIRDIGVTGVQTCALPILVLGDGTDADVVALQEDPLEVAVQIFHVRGGRVRGQRGWVAEKTEDVDTGELVRSEERRVGKEGRSRWAPDHYKKKYKSPSWSM